MPPPISARDVLALLARLGDVADRIVPAGRRVVRRLVGDGRHGARGFIDAYDQKTGKRVWRRYTVPSAGEKGVDPSKAKAALERLGGGLERR